MISAKIIADSINPYEKRLTSFLITYPRFIHSEFMTHRAFSRNAASSRAIPLVKMIADIRNEIAFPEYWAAEHKGMAAVQRIADLEVEMNVKPMWIAAAEQAVSLAEKLSAEGVAKSLCNRLLEPFAHITVLATASNAGLHNFFALRAHAAAMPEFQVLAYRMLDCYIKSQPKVMQWGDWHIPSFYIEDGQLIMEKDDIDMRVVKVATARCARLSYLTHEGAHSIEKDIELHDRLLAAGHMSPFEHCAQAMRAPTTVSNFDGDEFSSWEQYRKRLANENRSCIDLAAQMATKPDWIAL